MGIGLRAEVDVTNPSPVPAQTDPGGKFTIKYRAETIGEGVLAPVSIPASSHTTVIAEVKVDAVPAPVVLMMVQELLSLENQLTLTVHGSVTARVEKILAVNCQVQCVI